MEIKEIEKMLEKNSKVMLKIRNNGKNYVKVMGEKAEYKYYEVLEDTIKLIEDKNLLEYFKNIYEIKESDIIY